METFAEKFGPAALVTGASDGIGRAIAIELARRGLDLVLVARRGDALDRLASTLSAEYAVNAKTLAADLSAASEVDRLKLAFDDLDLGLFVAAAGFGTSGNFLNSSAEDEERLIDLNCRAVVSLSRWFAPKLASRRRGGIMLFSSIVAFQGVGNAANYAASKAFIQTFAEGLAADLAGTGVKVLAAAPGPVISGFGARAGMSIRQGSSATAVARGSVRALQSRHLIAFADFRSAVLNLSLAPLPRFMRSLVLGRIMRGMTKHHAGRATPSA